MPASMLTQKANVYSCVAPKCGFLPWMMMNVQLCKGLPLEVVTSLCLKKPLTAALLSLPGCFQPVNIYYYRPRLKGIHTLTVGKHIVVNCGGRREAAQSSWGVPFLQSEPLSAAVDPRSPPHCGWWTLHHFSSQTAGIQGGLKLMIKGLAS